MTVTTRSDPQTCRSPLCRARIIWALSPAGKRLCLDAEPITLAQAMADPKHVYVAGGNDRLVKWLPDPADVLDGESFRPLYRSHWVTCEDRDRFKTR